MAILLGSGLIGLPMALCTTANSPRVCLTGMEPCRSLGVASLLPNGRWESLSKGPTFMMTTSSSNLTTGSTVQIQTDGSGRRSKTGSSWQTNPKLLTVNLFGGFPRAHTTLEIHTLSLEMATHTFTTAPSSGKRPRWRPTGRPGNVGLVLTAMANPLTKMKKMRVKILKRAKTRVRRKLRPMSSASAPQNHRSLPDQPNLQGQQRAKALGQAQRSVRHL